jgi:hypothetical protein
MKLFRMEQQYYYLLTAVNKAQISYYKFEIKMQITIIFLPNFSAEGRPFSKLLAQVACRVGCLQREILTLRNDLIFFVFFN